MDQPTTDGLNTWLISRIAAEHVKGVLSGLGGDEWFAGYPVTRRIARYTSGWGRIHAVAGGVASVVRHLVPSSAFRRRLEGLIPRTTPLATWLDDHRVFGHSLAGRLVYGAGAESMVEEALERLRSLAGYNRRESAVGVSCRLDVGAYMGCQLLRDCDAVSMAHSLELRVPLVDIRVAEFARSCADEFKLRAGGGDGPQYGPRGSKRVLIRALRDVMPAGIARWPKKGFALPHD